MYHRLVENLSATDRNTSGRILAVDFGLKRIGLAVSDPLDLTAQGLPTLERTSLDRDLSHICNLAERYSAALVILGNPVARDGEPTRMSRRVAEFGQKLQRRLPCPVELWDERLTSVEAYRVLRSSGIGIHKRRQAIDRVAATLLLQGYLDRRAFERQHPTTTSAGEPM